jgi:hypothetical protein
LAHLCLISGNLLSLYLGELYGELRGVLLADSALFEEGSHLLNLLGIPFAFEVVVGFSDKLFDILGGFLAFTFTFGGFGRFRRFRRFSRFGRGFCERIGDSFAFAFTGNSF